MNPTRKTDEKFYRLFSTFHAFSEHLTKREDNELRDKYDHNAFCYSGQPTEDELRAALAYQKARCILLTALLRCWEQAFFSWCRSWGL